MSFPYMSVEMLMSFSKMQNKIWWMHARCPSWN